MKATGKCEEFEIEVGAVVQLKSGGPAMTVEKLEERIEVLPDDEVIVETTGVQCVWFNASGFSARATFAPVSLRAFQEVV